MDSLMKKNLKILADECIQSEIDDWKKSRAIRNLLFGDLEKEVGIKTVRDEGGQVRLECYELEEIEDHEPKTQQ